MPTSFLANFLGMAKLVGTSVASVIILGVIAYPEPAHAQAVSDEFFYQDADAHASCDSKTLPQAGFFKVGVVSNTGGKECYWRRATNQIGSQVQQPPSLRTQIEAAQVRKEAALDKIDATRRNSWSAFWRSFEACNGDAKCRANAIRAHIDEDRNLDTQTARVNQLFRQEIQRVLHAQIRRDEPAVAPVRP